MTKLVYIRLVCAFITAGTFAAVPINAQDQDWEEDGEIQDAEVIIEKDRQIELPPANRSYQKVAPLPIEVDRSTQTYSFEKIDYQATPFTPNIRVLTIKDQPLSKLYGNYIKAGVGNYGTSLLEGYFNNKRSDTYVIGGKLKSLASSRGPVDKRNSAASDLLLGFDGSYFTDGVIFTGEAEYQRIKRFFYGYTPGTEVDRDTLKQVYNKILISLGLEDSNKNPDLDYGVRATFTSFEDRWDNSEDQGSFNFTGSYQFNDQVKFGVLSDLHFSQYKLAEIGDQNRTYFRIRPTVETEIDVFKVELGLNVVYENDTIQNMDKVHLSPVAKASYQLTDNAVLYAGLTGDVDYRSWQSYVKENPFLAPNVALSHNIKTLEINGGLKGKLWEEVNFNTGLSIGFYNNLAFFPNSGADSTKFDIVYDTDGPSIVRLFAELGYSKAQHFIINFKGELLGYDTDEVIEPWGRHTYSVGVNGSYNLYQKLILSGSITALGGIKGFNLQSGTVRELDGIFDVNLSVDYLFSPRFSVFVTGKNLVSQNYQRYMNYPARGITVIGGVSYSF